MNWNSLYKLGINTNCKHGWWFLNFQSNKSSNELRERDDTMEPVSTMLSKKWQTTICI